MECGREIVLTIPGVQGACRLTRVVGLGLMVTATSADSDNVSVRAACLAVLSPIRGGAATTVWTAIQRRLAIEPGGTNPVAATPLARNEEERYRALVERSPLPIGVHSRGIIVYMNPAALQIAGAREPGEIIGRPMLDFVHPDYRALVAERARRAAERGEPAPAAEEKFLRLDGQVLDVVMASMPTMFEGQPAVQVAMYDITERKRAEALLVQQALHDSLTGLPNRAYLDKHLCQLIDSALSNNEPLALLIIDLDRFKEVNDSLGHRFGDLVLKQVTERWKSCLTEACFLARVGGDEFAIVVPGSSGECALDLGRQLQRALDQPFTIEGHRFGLGASIGIARLPNDGDNAEMLQRHADMAMYAAKQMGSGCLVYISEHDLYRPERLSLVSDLREAIDTGQMLLHYQPQIRINDGRVHGLEALVRWRHPLRGLVPPDAFIPLAEQTGLIGRLTRCVLEGAIRDASVWRLDGQDISVGVNVSVRDLHDPELPRFVEFLLDQYRLPAACLKLEITESSLMSEPERAARTLESLRGLGVRISVDDFGTGYSSLAYLKGLPVDEIKLDRTFIKDLTTTPADRAIVRATVALGNDLGMRVVAEGVEDVEALQLLRSLECDLAQGYLIARPQPAAEMTSWLRSRGDASAALAA